MEEVNLTAEQYDEIINLLNTQIQLIYKLGEISLALGAFIGGLVAWRLIMLSKNQKNLL